MYGQRPKWVADRGWDTVLWTLIVLASSFLLALFAQSHARAAWGRDGCGPVGPRAVAPEAPPFTGWRFYQDRYYYYRDGVQVAGWDPKEKVYRSYDAGRARWSAPQRPPWQPDGQRCPSCPGSAAACQSGEACDTACTDVVPPTLPKWMTHGVQVERLNGHERYALNGRAAGAVPIPGDAQRTRLIIIGRDDEQQRVRDDLQHHPALAALTRNLVVHHYRPDHWHVARAGYDTGGHPGIYLVAADGKVLSRSTSYAGPERLAEAIRKADPKYDPSKDPDLTRTQASANSSLPLYLLGGLLLLFLVVRNRS